MDLVVLERRKDSARVILEEEDRKKKRSFLRVVLKVLELRATGRGKIQSCKAKK